jgi:hypothetical protein
MNANYVLWGLQEVPHGCVLKELVGVEKLYELKNGVPRAADFPDKASYRMHPDFPHHTILTDNLLNTDRLIVGSARLREFLEARSVQKVEYLPVLLRNPKGKVVSKTYAIINPIDPVDCLDVAKSGVTMSKIVKNKIQAVKKIVLDPSRVDAKRELFRLRGFPHVTLVRRELAEAIDGEGFTGIRWVELSAYPED